MYKISMVMACALLFGCQSENAVNSSVVKDTVAATAPITGGQDTTVSEAELITLQTAGLARMYHSGAKDSVNSQVLKIESKDSTKKDSIKLKIGEYEIPSKDGQYYLPIPEMRDFCGARIVIDVVTRKGTFKDTVFIKGSGCDDTLQYQNSRSEDIEFDFRDSGVKIWDKSNTYPAKTSGVRWIKDDVGYTAKIVDGAGIDFGELVTDADPEGAIEILFKPDSNFTKEPARTIFGNDGSRIHIGWMNGQIFFQKNWDNLHRFVASDTGFLKDGKWHKIVATWGAQGMTVSLDDVVIAWSNDISSYQAGPTGYPFGNSLKIGDKTTCCMEPQRVLYGSANGDLQASGSYKFIAVRKSQPKVWSDMESHACKVQTGLPVPRCGLTTPGYVNYPIW